MIAAGMPPGYLLCEGYPNVDDYVHLRRAAGLTPKNAEQAAAAIRGSWAGYFVAEAARPDTAIAMGRIVGDGGWYFIIADMAVLPAHQRRGLGDVILKNLLARIRDQAAGGDAYVTLSADEPGRRLYERNGFQNSMPKEMGMTMVMKDCGRRVKEENQGNEKPTD